MAKFHKPYPNEIYVINNLLPKDYSISTFNSVNRCYNYNIVCSEKRSFADEIFEESNILSFFKKHWDNFEQYIDTYLGKDRNVMLSLEPLKREGDLNDDEKESIHYNLLKIYNSFPTNPKKNIDGILKREEKSRTSNCMLKSDLGQKDVRFKYAKASLLNHLQDEALPPVELSLYDDINSNTESRENTEPSSHMFCSQDQKDLELFGTLDELESALKRDQNNNGAPSRNDFFYNYLWPLFKSPANMGNDYVHDNKQSEIQGYHIVPIYSAILPDGDYGTILGYIYFERKPEENEPDKIVEALWEIWAPLAAQTLLKSREEVLLAQPIKYGDDILKDLLSKVTFVQDWEKAAVFKKNPRGEYDLRYCFRRYPGNAEDGHQKYEEIWDICNPEEKWEKCETEGCYIRSLGAKNQIEGKMIDGKCFYWWHIKHILDPLVLPSVVQEEISRYENHVVCFEFPEYTFFPPRNDKEQTVTDSPPRDDKEVAITKVGKHYVDKLTPIFGKLLLKKRVLQHSIKSAVSAIISRNHSHHIGSHVTPRISMEKIRERLTNLGYAPKQKQEFEIINRLKSHLDEYTQKKADFMAEIATEPLTTTISKSFFREVLLYFIQNTLLADNIGANEGVNYKSQGGKTENRLKIHFLFKGKELKARFNGQCCDRTFDHTNLPYIGLCDCDKAKELFLTTPEGGDVSIAWPGPLGNFSLYCFLENFIRNAIKHNHEKLRDNRPLNIYVSVKELDENDSEKYEFYKIEIWEDVTDPCKLIHVNNDGGKSKQSTLKKHIAGLIDSEIVDKHGRLEKGAWGIAEMKIMATLMRGSDDFTSMNPNLRVGCCKRNGEERLIYEFRVMKPKELAIVTECSPEEKNRIYHKEQGVWWFKSFDELKAYQTIGLSPATFEIVVIDKGIYAKDKEKINNHSHLLPYRVIIADQSIEKSVCDDNFLLGAIRAKINLENVKEMDAGEIISDFWDKWIDGLMKKNRFHKPRVELFLQQKMEEPPTSEWKVKAEDWEIKNNKSVKLSIISTDKTSEENINIIPEVLNGESHFIYDRHFRGIGILDEPADLENRPPLFHEAFDKSSSDFVPIFASSPTPKMIYQLAEAAALRVLIIDERVAEVAYKNMIRDDKGYANEYYEQTQRLQVAEWSKIFIATHLKVGDKPAVPVHHSIMMESPRVCVKCAPSDPEVQSSQVPVFKAYWCTSTNCTHCSNTEPIDLQPNAVIMHQGITEGILKDAILKNNKPETFAEALTVFLNDVKTHVSYVVIDSGRGIPANLPETAKFLPFSLIEDYLMKDRMAKFSLTRVLMSIVRRGEG